MKICLNGALLAAMVVSTTHAEQCSDWSWSHCPTNRGCSKQGKGKNKSCVGTLATNAPIPSPTQPPATTCNDIEEEADCLGATFGTEQCHWQGSGNNKHCDVYHAPAANSCAGFDEEIDCVTSDLNCVYKSSGNPSERCQPYDPNEACSVRGTKESECEIDDKCMLKKGGGSTACVEVPVGTGTTNATCAVKLIQDPDGDYYEEDATNGCDGTNTCVVIDASGFFDYNTPVPGKCQSTECVGKKVPGNCNGNTQNKDQCESQTSRVTICHRTCSRKNPWVRITIDEDAWDGEGCGHQQHDIRDECKNKAPWAEWGPNRRDYLLVQHGTRDQVAATRSTAEVKAYWRQWEPACPYVRNGHCCEWDNPLNPCCGIHPDSSCDFDMGENDESLCPGYDAVGLMDFKADNQQIIPADMDPSTMLYGLQFDGTAPAPEVSFKINNPFDFAVDTYIQYHKKAVGSKSGALDPACIAEPAKAACDANSEPVTAGCIVPHNGEPPFSLVTVFFLSTDVLFGAGGSGVAPYECCPIPNSDLTGGKKIIEYTFKVLCQCPDDATTAGDRLLRSSSTIAQQKDLDLWNQAVGTGH